SMLQHNKAVYELFEYIRGDAYDNSPEATSDSGKTPAPYHKLLREHTPEFEPPVGSYHQSNIIDTSITRIPETFNKLEEVDAPEDKVKSTLAFLKDSYDNACASVEKHGLSGWPSQI